MFVIVLMISVFFGVKYSAAGRSANGKHFGISQQKAGDLPLGKRHSRPKLTLESALRIAQTFIQKQQSASSSYWLIDAHFILYGGENLPDEEISPYWTFRWLNDSDGRVIDKDISGHNPWRGNIPSSAQLSRSVGHPPIR
jgi:hypothetical protein